jgi:hypothetical protein
VIVSFFLCPNIVSSKKHRCDAHSWRINDWMPNIVEIVFDKRDVVEINEIGHKEKSK